MGLQSRKAVGLVAVVVGGATLAGLALVAEPRWLLVFATVLVMVTVLAVGALVVDGQRALRAELSGVSSQMQQIAEQQEATRQVVTSRASERAVRDVRVAVEHLDARTARRVARQADASRRHHERLRRELHGHVARLELAQEATQERSVAALRADVRRLQQTVLLVDELTGSGLPPLDALGAGDTEALAHLAAVARRCRPRVVVIDACGAATTEVALALVAAHGAQDVVLDEVPEVARPGSMDRRAQPPAPRIHRLHSDPAPAPVSLLVVGERSGPVQRRLEELVAVLGPDLADDAVVVDVTAMRRDATRWVDGHDGFVIEPADATGTLEVIRRR